MAKIHKWISPEAVRVLCGEVDPPRRTNDDASVTCKKCLKKLNPTPKDQPNA